MGSKKPTKSLGELLFFQHCKDQHLTLPEREYRFSLDRRWRFDFAWPDDKLAVEVEGGVWQEGRHNRGSGFVSDCEKYNHAVLMGWRILRFPTQQIMDGTAITTVCMALRGAPC